MTSNYVFRKPESLKQYNSIFSCLINYQEEQKDSKTLFSFSSTVLPKLSRKMFNQVNNVSVLKTDSLI